MTTDSCDDGKTTTTTKGLTTEYLRKNTRLMKVSFERKGASNTRGKEIQEFLTNFDIRKYFQTLGVRLKHGCVLHKELYGKKDPQNRRSYKLIS